MTIERFMSKLRLLTRATGPQRPTWSRWVQLACGIIIFGLSAALMIQSGLGLGPWDALHVGLHRLTGMSVGIATIIVGAVIVAGTYLIKVRPGAGTLANMVFIGVFTDVFLVYVPPVSGLPFQLAVFMGGVMLCAFATGLYISAGLGKGPRDGLMIGISQLSGWRVGPVRTGIEVIVLIVGWLMGGTVGIGTLIFAATIGPATQWGLRLFGMSATGATREEQEAALREVSMRRAA